MRQYIGARYVPKFADPILHDSTRSYEAFEIVQNAVGDSFTSKKPVPVGVALTDTNYWVSSGNFNSQLALCQHDIDIVRSEKTIFISDSYGVNNGGWIDQLAGTQLIDAADVIKLASGGIGFHDDGYLTLLQNAVISDPDMVTRIVVCGGANDHTMTEADIISAIDDFADYARANYPNAKLYLGHIGWSTNATLREKYATITIPGYKACNKHGMTYLNGVEYAMHYYGYFDGDGVHPTAFACKELARYIMQSLITGEVNIDWMSPIAVTKWNMQGNDWYWYTTVIENEVEVVTNDFTLTFSSTTINGGTDHSIGTLSTTDFIYGYPNQIRNYVMCTVLVNGTDFVPCLIGIQQTGTNTPSFTMKFVNTLIGVNSIKIPNLSFRVKLLYC